MVKERTLIFEHLEQLWTHGKSNTIIQGMYDEYIPKIPLLLESNLNPISIVNLCEISSSSPSPKGDFGKNARGNEPFEVTLCNDEYFYQKLVDLVPKPLRSLISSGREVGPYLLCSRTTSSME